MSKSKIEHTLRKVAAAIPTPSSQNISGAAKVSLGNPDCPHCRGVGYVRYEAPLGDPRFGRLEPCVCRSAVIVQIARQRLFELSHLDQLADRTFENFHEQGHEKAQLTEQEKRSLQTAKEMAEDFARRPEGWLLLEGGYGCGKTHLAAAIANAAVSQGILTLFITVPDLLDFLRFAFRDPETTFEERFEEVRNVGLLVLDDFGTQNATPWAQEKLFQIVNYRYINKLPTVITTNLLLDQIESRIRSRLQDKTFVRRVRILAPDYRRPDETSNPEISILTWPEIRAMTFENFESRADEIGEEVVVVTTVEQRDSFGNKFKEKTITRVSITKKDLKTLHDAVQAAIAFAEKPRGWLTLLGDSYCGKTHLAAAIGNHCIALGGQALMLPVADLLDYLRQTFSPNSDVSFDRRFYEIRTTPLLILDDLKERGASSIWAEEKLYQLLNYRYHAELPTVITSTLHPDEFALNYPALWNKLLDATKSQVYLIEMPPYRRITRGKGAYARRWPAAKP